MLSASPTAGLTLQQGQGATQTTGGPPPCAGTITTTGIAGFTGSVNLTQTSYTDSTGATTAGLPTGVSVTIAPSEADLSVSNDTAESTVTFAAAADAAVGTYTIAFTGTDGNLSHTTTLSLQVTGSGGSSAWIEVDHANADGSVGATFPNPIGDSVDVSLVLKVAPGETFIAPPSNTATLSIQEDHVHPRLRRRAELGSSSTLATTHSLGRLRLRVQRSAHHMEQQDARRACHRPRTYIRLGPLRARRQSNWRRHWRHGHRPS